MTRCVDIHCTHAPPHGFLCFLCDCYELSQLMAGDVTINLYMHDILPQNGLNVNLFISIPYSITGWQRGWTSSGCDNRNIRPDLSYLGSHVQYLVCTRVPGCPLYVYRPYTATPTPSVPPPTSDPSQYAETSFTTTLSTQYPDYR